MRQQQETGSGDIYLLLFVSIAVWLLIFQSGLFN